MEEQINAVVPDRAEATEPVLLGSIINEAEQKLDVLFDDPDVVIRLINICPEHGLTSHALTIDQTSAVLLHDALCDAIEAGIIQSDEE